MGMNLLPVQKKKQHIYMKSRLQPSAFWQMEIYCQTETGNEDAHFGVSLKTIYADLGWGVRGVDPLLKIQITKLTQ